MRENRRKYLKKIAKSYYLEQRKYKCLMSWHSISSKVNLEASKLFEQMSSKNPYAAEILLEKMCHDFYMG